MIVDSWDQFKIEKGCVWNLPHVSRKSKPNCRKNKAFKNAAKFPLTRRDLAVGEMQKKANMQKEAWYVYGNGIPLWYVHEEASQNAYKKAKNRLHK